jgi:hypothetical protein
MEDFGAAAESRLLRPGRPRAVDGVFQSRHKYLSPASFLLRLRVMSRAFCWIALFLVAAKTSAAELKLDFSQFPLNETPRGFRSTVSGQGNAGEWRVILDEAASQLPAFGSNAAALTKKAVLAQLSGDSTDEHFPILIFEDETFGDFTLTTRFKNVRGTVEQMAGIAFRIKDERNYYYVRASSLGNTFRFFKLVDGQRSAPIGPEIEIPKGVWHELTVECKGNRIRCLLNGKEIIPPLTDSSFTSGKIGFWTKSDSVSYFADTKIVYTPHESLAKALVREALHENPRLAGLKIYAVPKSKPTIRIIASSNEKEVGFSGTSEEQDVISRDAVYFGKESQTAFVTLPLHDRNGETVAAVRVVLKSFKGQTEQNAIARALPIVKQMEARIRSSTDRLE